MYIEIIRLEKQIEEYEAEIIVKEKKLLQLREELETAERKYNDLENSGLKKMLLGFVGKKEEYLQNTTNELRRVRSEVANEEFFITSSQTQIQQMEEQIKELEAQLPADENLMDAFYKARKIPALQKVIAEVMQELKEHFAFAERVHYYGDLHADMSGKRYDRKDSTQRECASKIKAAIGKLRQLLEEYNEIVPDEITIEFFEDWMNDEDYWAGQQLEEDSYSRIKKVDDWFFRLNTVWKKIQKKQNEVVENLRNEVLNQ